MQGTDSQDVAKAYCDLGLALFNKGKYEESIENLNKAIELDLNCIKAYVHRGGAYIKKGHYEKAIEDYSKAIAVWPNFTSGYNCRGLAFHLNGKYERALEDYNKAATLNPEDTNYYNIACVYSLSGTIAEACNYLKKAIDKGFTDWEKIEKDNDFDNVRESDAYKQIIEGLKGSGNKEMEKKQADDGKGPNYIDIGIGQGASSGESKEIDYTAINNKLKNIYPEKIETNQDKIKFICDRISKWSNSIPHHDLTNLGNKIEIVSAIEKPSYRITVQTLYEKRELKRGTEPHEGGQIPQKTLTEDNVDIWSFSTPLIDDFKEEKQTYRITASQEVSQCWKCKGRGEVVCYSCDGSGVERCSSCSGRSEVKCSSCGGSGEHRCYSCGGSGQKEEYRDGRTIKVRCSSCAGRGHDPCTSCKNGWQNCSRCGGRGEVTCDTCSGRGMLTCSLCDGYREVVSYLYFNDIFTPTTKTELINHLNLPAEIVSGESIHIYPEEGINEKTLKINDADGNAVLEVNHKMIPEIIVQPANHEAFKNAAIQMLSGSYERTDLGVSGKDYRLLKQRLAIDCLDAVEVNYKLGKKPYTIWLYGQNSGILFAPTSPISEVCDKYFSLAQNLLSKKEYSEALDSVDKALKMNPKRDDIKTLKGKIVGRIGNQYLYGGLLGGSIAGALMSLILKFVMSLSMGADKIFMVGTAIGSGIGLVVGLIFRLASSTKIKESKKRFLYPLLTTVFIIIVSGLMYMVIANNAGR